MPLPLTWYANEPRSINLTSAQCRETDNLWKNQAPLPPITAPNSICMNPLHLNQNNQSEPEGVSDGVSITALHLPSPAHALTWSSSVSSVSGHNGGQTATKQPNNEKTLPTTAFTTKTSKKNNTNKEKQAEKNQLATLRGRFWMQGWSVVEREGPGSCTLSNFQAESTLFLNLSTSAVRQIPQY